MLPSNASNKTSMDAEDNKTSMDAEDI